jgi:glycosyltransferase involved in cell wall biosynthesis
MKTMPEEEPKTHPNHGASPEMIDATNAVKEIWITWEKQRRNEGISSGLGIDLYEVISKKKRLSRYWECTVITLKILKNVRPDIVVAQNPSIVLAMLVILLKPVFKVRVIIDAHNSGLFPGEGRSAILMAISRYILKKSDMTLVTNGMMADYVRCNGGRPFVLPDKIPELKLQPEYAYKGTENVLFICTYAEDEPYLEVFDAMALVPDNIQLYVTGKYEGKVSKPDLWPNIHLMGFVPEKTYLSALCWADAVMDLTTREGCLVCGAYEGLAFAKPLILSNTRAIKEYFSEGTVYVDTDKESISAGLVDAIKNKNHLSDKSARLKSMLEDQWQAKAKALKSALASLVCNRK